MTSIKPSTGATATAPATATHPTPRLRILRSAMAALAVGGGVLPWVFNLRYFADGGSLAPGVFFRDAFANALTSAITVDVYLAAVAFSVAVAADRGAGRARWWALPLTFGIGLAMALPGYLWWRLGRPDAQAIATTAASHR